jgi:hypothetical protein
MARIVCESPNVPKSREMLLRHHRAMPVKDGRRGGFAALGSDTSGGCAARHFEAL